MKLVAALGMILILIGFWGLLTRRNMIRMVLSIAIAEVGLQLLMVSAGYIEGKTAPILDSALVDIQGVVDPVPQALVLTAIVIGVAVNALMLAFVIRLYGHKKSLDIGDYTESKW